MSRRERAARILPQPSVVPLAPSFLDLEQETTVAYDARVPLPALLAEARRSIVANDEMPNKSPVVATTSSEIRPRTHSFHTSPHFPEDSNPGVAPQVESNLHVIEAEGITDSLVPSAPRLEIVHVSDRLSSVPPPSLPPALVEPRVRKRRSPLVATLLTAIGVGFALLAAIEISVATNLPWLDPRPVLTKSFVAAKSKIPWDRLPRLSQP
jgi:hypothetical protein